MKNSYKKEKIKKKKKTKKLKRTSNDCSKKPVKQGREGVSRVRGGKISGKKRPYAYLTVFFKKFIFMSMQSINNSCEDLGQSVFNCKIGKGSKK